MGSCWYTFLFINKNAYLQLVSALISHLQANVSNIKLTLIINTAKATTIDDKTHVFQITSSKKLF